MVNNVVLIGRLTRDPELRKTQNGTSVTNFTVAVNDKFDKEKANFIRCIAWKQTADFLAKYATKGALVSVEGRIETGSYQDTDGKTVYTTDVVANSVQLLENRAMREEQQTVADVMSQQSTQDYEQEQNGPAINIQDDDLPF